TVFGYPGGAALNTYDALYKYRDRITHYLTAHEQGASHAADGYARSTGKVGVVFSTSGPGATNLVTGIATANIDSIPLVAICGNVSSDLLGRDAFQEVAISEIAKPITKKTYLVENVEDLADTIREAFFIAMSGRKGPVLIDVPKDVTAKVCEYTPAVPKEIVKPVLPKQEYIDEVTEIIKNAKRPLIYAGGGIISADASKEFIEFAERIDAPVFCSLMAMGAIPFDHPLFVGNIGMHGGYESGKATDEADVIIACGARFSDRVAGDREKFGQNAKIIQFDIDKKEIHKNVKVDAYLLGDIKDTLKCVNENMPQKDSKEWVKTISSWKEKYVVSDKNKDGFCHPYQILDALNEIKGRDDFIATDVGQHQMWVAQRTEFYSPRTFLTSGGMGTMGFGMGGAIGAAVSHKDKKTVLITGDGSFHMNINELVTMKSYNIPVVIIVMNNSVLGMVRQWQKLFYEARFSQTDPNRATDFVEVAKGYGVKGLRITKPEEIKDVLKKAYDMNEPVVVDCVISKDENVLPMIPPGKTVEDIVVEME
ncbi:MAG: biosynthetic-type acetolactate synthase large subunit, partial [Acutalibacteraceae bacterium]